MPELIFSAWKPEHTEGWNRRSMNLPHTLHRNPLFSLDALAELIISVTTEHWTGANRRGQRMLLANGVLRNRLHLRPASRALAGPGYWAKVALQAVWRRSPWAASAQRAHRPVEFRLDPGAPGGLGDPAVTR